MTEYYVNATEAEADALVDFIDLLQLYNTPRFTWAIPRMRDIDSKWVVQRPSESQRSLVDASTITSFNTLHTGTIEEYNPLWFPE